MTCMMWCTCVLVLFKLNINSLKYLILSALIHFSYVKSALCMYIEKTTFITYFSTLFYDPVTVL